MAPYNPLPVGLIFLSALANYGLGLGNLLSMRRTWPDYSANLWTLEAAMLPLLLVLSVVFYVRPAPLVLTPDGLHYCRFRTRTVSWDALPPSGPPPPRQRLSQLRLPVRAATSTGYRWIAVPLNQAFADSAFLAYAIYYYATNPAVRQAIGTTEGLGQLVAAFHRTATASELP